MKYYYYIPTIGLVKIFIDLFRYFYFQWLDDEYYKITFNPMVFFSALVIQILEISLIIKFLIQ